MADAHGPTASASAPRAAGSGRLVAVVIAVSAVAGEELSFARVLEAFLAGAVARRDALLERARGMQARLATVQWRMACSI